MSDRTAVPPAGARPDAVLDGVLVVHTMAGWNLTLADRRQPTPVSDAAVHALVRASGGAHLPVDDPGRRELAGLGLEPGAPSTPGGVDTGRDGAPDDSPEWRPVHPDTPALPLPVFVGQVFAGSLLVEGHGGRQELLDEVDLFLLEALVPDGTAGQVVDAVRSTLGDGAPPADELSGRLRRLADVGRMLLHVDDRRGLVPAEQAAPPAPAEPEVVSLGLRAELRRAPFPGRRYAHRAYRLLRGARPAPPPVAEPDPLDAAVAAPADPGVEPAPTAAEPAGAVPADAEGTAEAPAFDLPGQVTYLDAPDLTAAPEGAIPVYSVFPVETGPPLSLGMLLANVRAWDGGVLNRTFELRRMEDPASFFADVAARPGPAVLLLSNYVWSLDHNLEVARRARALNPELVIIHGGPSAPKYEAQCEEWFAEKGDIVDVTVRNEGEITLAEALVALAGSEDGLDLARLEGVAGLTFRHPVDGRIVRTEERERMADLDELPSPYLTGEFDHIDPSAWTEVTIETTRGCPYGCTFCDWGSSTLSRIRKFDIDRVAAEMHWAGERQFDAWAMGDANFGIMSRDVEVTHRVVEVRERWGYPKFFGFNVAKNTTKHLTVIVDELVKAGIGPMFTLALQTRDEETLEAVRRTNISTEHYTSLASSLRRRGLPLRADIMLGLPGQTVDSLAGDLQFLMDHEVPARMWITQLLPNAPINDPEYRAEWEVQDDHGVVVATKSFTVADRELMLRLRHAYTVYEQFGLLRHVTRHVQWDHGVDIMTTLRRIVAVSDDDPGRYPLLNWTMRYFDYFNAPPLGWRSFYAEVRRFLAAEFGVAPSVALDTVLAVQEQLMPDVGRSFPSSIAAAHDYVRYYQDRTRPLWMSEPAATSGPPLTDYGPARFTVYADPLARCSTGTINVITDPRNESMTDDFWMYGHWEMDSALVVNQPQVAGSQRFIGLLEQIPDDLPDEVEPTSRASVRIGRARSGVAAGEADAD